MQRRQALRVGAGILAGSLSVTAGCVGIGTQSTAPIKLNNDTTSKVFIRVLTETVDGDFWREIEIIIPNNGTHNDPWFKEMFVDEGEYRVTVVTDDATTETMVTHPSNEWDYLSISVSQSGITIRDLSR